MTACELAPCQCPRVLRRKSGSCNSIEELLPQPLSQANVRACAPSPLSKKIPFVKNAEVRGGRLKLSVAALRTNRLAASAKATMNIITQRRKDSLTKPGQIFGKKRTRRASSAFP